MSERQQHRASLILALLGVLLMLATVFNRIDPTVGPALPNRESSRPMPPEGPDAFWMPRA
jgi:hypothetical protein